MRYQSTLYPIPYQPINHTPSTHQPISSSIISYHTTGDIKQVVGDDGITTTGVSSWANKWQDTDSTVNIDQPLDASLLESDYWPSTTDRCEHLLRTLSLPSLQLTPNCPSTTPSHHLFNPLDSTQAKNRSPSFYPTILNTPSRSLHTC